MHGALRIRVLAALAFAALAFAALAFAATGRCRRLFATLGFGVGARALALFLRLFLFLELLLGDDVVLCVFLVPCRVHLAESAGACRGLKLVKELL